MGSTRTFHRSPSMLNWSRAPAQPDEWSDPGSAEPLAVTVGLSPVGRAWENGEVEHQPSALAIIGCDEQATDTVTLVSAPRN